MKMIYHPGNKKKNSKSVYVWVVCIGLILLTILLNFLAPHVFSSVVHAVGKPLMHMRNYVITSIWSEEVQGLREDRAYLEASRLENKALQEENAALRVLLGRNSSTTPMIVAEVLSKPGYSLYDTLLVDAGQAEGVLAGAQVLIDDAVIIGEVSEVYAHSSTIRLYSSPEQKTDVFVGTTSLQTTALGKGGGNFEIRLPRNTDVQEGDIVRRAQSPSYILGSVTAIESSHTDSFIQVLFRGGADISRVRFVSIEKQKP